MLGHTRGTPLRSTKSRVKSRFSPLRNKSRVHLGSHGCSSSGGLHLGSVRDLRPVQNLLSPFMPSTATC